MVIEWREGEHKDVDLEMQGDLRPKNHYKDVGFINYGL
jgi:hypothetical protein